MIRAHSAYALLLCTIKILHQGDLLQGFKRALASWPLELSRAPVLHPRVYLPPGQSGMELGPPQGFSVQINPFVSLLLCGAKGSGPSSQTQDPGLADAVNLFSLGTTRDPCLAFRSASVLSEMASGGESTGLQTRVPHLPLVGHRSWGVERWGPRSRASRREECRLQQLLPLPRHQGVWLQGGMEGERARKKGWDLGTRAVSLGRREQVVACLSAQLFCISVPESLRGTAQFPSSWEEKKRCNRGP